MIVSKESLTLTLSRRERGKIFTLALVIEGEGRVRVYLSSYYAATTGI
jgi:hypothetical protein